MTTAVRDQAVVGGALLRVRSGDTVIGAAFLVAPGLAATTAHVVAEALGVDPLDEPPSDEVSLDFPLLRADREAPAQVTARVERWSPGGIALLRLAGMPPGARMPPLRRVDGLDGRSFQVLGFPEGLTDGVWATGLIGIERGVLHLRGAEGEQPIDPGFSGAPVWEKGTGAVVGMAVATHGATPVLIPIDEVTGHDPERMPCPYRGLRAFDEEHADAFFGRDDDIARLLDAAGRLPVVAVAGPSGSGKSSLVRAGLVPRLRAGGTEIAYLRAEPGATVPTPADGERGFMLVVDQFEELAALDPVAARRMLERIVRLAESHAVRAVLTVRWTTLDELLTPELIDTLEAGTILVGPLGRERLHDAIVRPAEQPPGLAFEDGLVERILDDAGAEPGQLPLVESLLTDLWERRDGGYLTLREYEAAGGVAGALSQHAERVVAALPSEQVETLRRLLIALARPDHGGRFVRRSVPLADLPAAQRALVPALTAGRLLVVGRSARDADVVELAHQALIDHWPRLRSWLLDDGEFLAWRERVGGQRERWEAEGRADTVLLRGAALAAASRWLPTRRDDLPAVDVDYLRRSSARQRRDVRRWRFITAVVAVLTVAAAVLTVVAVRSADDVAAQLATANGDTLGRESQIRAATDPTLAAQLALAAWREDPRGPQARAALARSYTAMRGVEQELVDITRAPITGMLVGGDAAVLVAAPNPTLVTGLSGPAPHHEVLADVPSESQMSMSPDGRRLAYQAPDRSTMRLRDLTTGTAQRTLPSPDGSQVYLPRFSPDGERLAWVVHQADTTFVLRIWDLRSDTEVRHGMGPLPEDTAAVFLTPDPGRVLVRRGFSLDSRLLQLSLTDGAELATMPAGSAAVLGGAGVASCESGRHPLGRAATIVVTPMDSSPARRVPTVHVSCEEYSNSRMLTTNGRALIDKDARRSLSDRGTLRIIDLSTGEPYEVDAPMSFPPTSEQGFVVEPSLALMPSRQRPTALLARGSSLLRLTATPAAPAALPGERVIGMNDRFRVVRTDDGFFTSENGTGRRLGQVSVTHDPSSSAGIEDDTLWNTRPVAGGWEVTQHELPSLRTINRFLAPSRTGATPVGDGNHPPAIALHRAAPEDGGLLYVVGDGVLTAWEPGSAQPAGPPIPLGATDLQTAFHRSFPHLRVRPGHPGQVAVLSNTDVTLWDAVRGRQLATLPARADIDTAMAQRSTFVFDPTGSRLVVLAREPAAVQLWDVDTATQARPPIPAPDTERLVGFDADGYLQVIGNNDQLVSLDVATGVESAGPDMPPFGYEYLLDDGRAVRQVDPGAGTLIDVPVTAQAWHDALCAVADRPFTPAERDLLPPGTSTDPPC